MKKLFSLIILSAVLLCVTACNVQVNVTDSKDRGKSSSVMENVEHSTLEPVSSVCDSYDDFSKEQISDIENKVNKKEYSIISDTSNLRAIVICDLDADGTADALVITLCYKGDGSASKLDLHEVSNGIMKRKLSLQNGGFDDVGDEVECHQAFWEFDGLQVSPDGHEVTAFDTLEDVVNSESCRVENGKFVFKELSSKEYERNMTELYAMQYAARLSITPNDYAKIKENIENKKYVIYAAVAEGESYPPTENVFVCDIDSDGDFEAVVTGTVGSGMIYETFETLSLQNGNLLAENVYQNSGDTALELGMGGYNKTDIGISENGTEIIFTDNTDTICVWIENNEYVFSKNGEVQ